jgi:Protein of unknown function (DUF1524)
VKPYRLVVLLALLLAGCDARPASQASVDTPAGTASPGSSTSTAGSALALLGTLAVKGRAPHAGYDRDEFGSAWTDDNGVRFGHNGCDTRNDVLRRDLVDRTLKAGTHGCVVLTGVLHDPYTGTDIAFRRGEGTSDAVQIDHVVALSDAWQTGAQQWTRTQRVDLANDPLELLAVDGTTNLRKGDGDAATWLPPSKAYRCAYVARQVAVKARYRLWVTPAERDAVARVLGRCPDEPPAVDR